jgi:hypothetical protein
MCTQKSPMVVWVGPIMAAAMLVGCSEQVDSQRATSVKLGSSPTLVQNRLGPADFDFQMLVGNDQYLGESRFVGYSGQYLFIYRNGQFLKICPMPPTDLRYRPNWNHLAARVKLVLDEPGITEIPQNKRPPPDPEERRFFWNVIFPITILTLPAQPVFVVIGVIQYESQQPIRDFYQGRDIRLNQEEATIDHKKYGTTRIIGRYGGGRFIERFSQLDVVPDCCPCLDVMVQNGRVVGFFAVAGEGRLDDSSD